MTIFSSFALLARRIRLKETLLALPVLLIPGLVLVHLLSVSVICGTSMAPTLSDGQWAIVCRTAINPFLEVQHGDIVIVASEQTGTYLVKRVIALPGDTLQLKDGQLFLNGQYQYEPYIYEPMVDCDYSTIAEFTLPEGQYFVMGDNRNISKDSRAIGCVSTDEIYGVVYLQYQVPLTTLLIASIWLCASLYDRLVIFLVMYNQIPTNAEGADDETVGPAEPVAAV